MLLDRSSSMKPNFDLVEQAAEAFVGAMGPADRARIGSFSTQHPDRSARLHVGSRRACVDSPRQPAARGADAALERRQRRHHKLLHEQGRRVILVFTDGVDMPMNFSNRNNSLKDVMKRAEEEDVMVYAIGLAGENGMPTITDRGGDLSGRGRPGGAGAFGRRRLRHGRLWRRTAAAREARRRAAEDRGGDRRRLLRADVDAAISRRRSRASPTSSTTSTRSASRRRSSTARCTISPCTCRSTA